MSARAPVCSKNGATGRPRSPGRPVAPRTLRRVAGLRAPSGPPPIGASIVPGHPADDGPLADTTRPPPEVVSPGAASSPAAVADVSGHLRPEWRQTPSLGWEGGVWTRIERRRRMKRLVALVVAGAAIWVGVQVVWHRTTLRPAPVRVSVEVLGPLRPDGSTALPAVWQVRFEGGELRIYRNGLQTAHRCPGS